MRKIVISIFVLFFVATCCAATNTIKPYIKSINHTCLIVSNMDKTLHFYRDLLGFKVIYDKSENDPAKGKQPALKLRNIVLMGPNHYKLELDQFIEPKPIFSKSHSIFKVGYNHIGIEVTNVDKVYQLLTKNHVKTYSKPQSSKKMGYRFFFAKDPDGNYVEFLQHFGKTKDFMEL